MRRIPVDVGELINNWTIIVVPLTGLVTARCKCGLERTKWPSYFREHKQCSACQGIDRGLRIGAMPKDSEYGYRLLYKRYCSDARVRNKGFDITFEDFKGIVDSNCFYCNDEPHQRLGYCAVGVEFYYSGLDRIDSNKGYELDNVVPCCSMCNIMKNAYPQGDFITQVHKIAENRRKDILPLQIPK